MATRINTVIGSLLGGAAVSALAATLIMGCEQEADSGDVEVGTTTQAIASGQGQGRAAKYVFLLIGDGMASVQIHAAEAYLANQAEHDDVGGSEKAHLLAMSLLPVQGMQTTFPWSSLITDSAPAATAMATGMKTADGVISMDPTKTRDLTTIAEVAKRSGMKVGVVSSVSIDHATPAAFYAHEPSRNNYHAIGHDLVASGFDYFGGGGFVDPDGTRTGVVPQGNVIAAAEAAGYTVADSREEFAALRPGRKAIAINPVLDASRALYYEIDRVHAGDDRAHISLAEFTQKGIDVLFDRAGRRQGFFMMIEGGKIDWACHANDARAAIDDTLAFDDAVEVAVRFMQAHPQDTLVVVTGDHETGGMSLGWAGTAYASHFERLEAQRVSFLEFDKVISAVRAAGAPATLADSALDEAMLELMGLDYASLTPFEKARIDAAYTRSMTLGNCSSSKPCSEEEGLLYGGYDPLSVTITHVANNRAGIGWSSYSHTAVPVPVLAGGVRSAQFDGYYDNTDLARKLTAAMGLTLPI